MRSDSRGAGAAAPLEVQPHPRGPWLVRVGRRALAVPPDLGWALLPLHGQRVERDVIARQFESAAAGAAGPACAAPGPTPRMAAVAAAWLAAGAGAGSAAHRRSAAGDRALALRLVVLPAPLVRRLADRLAPLGSNAGLSFAAAAGLTAVACLRPWAEPPALSPLAVLLAAGGALWHELGHAAALRREGYAPGAVGAGLLVCLPVLYADVSAVRLLPRGGRLRVDLAGLAFQGGAAGLFAVLGATGLPWPALAGAGRSAAVFTLLAMAASLLPLPRSDGSWAVRDALAGDGAAPAGPRARRLGAALTVAHWLLAGLACRLLPARLVTFAAWVAGQAGRRPAPVAEAALANGLTIVALLLWARGSMGAWRRWRRERRCA